MKKYNVAIVGATGLVGTTFLTILEEYNFPINKIKLLASKRSLGKELCFRQEKIIVEELTKTAFEDIDLALFSAGGEISEQFAPIAVASGCLVIDNSSAFRMAADVGLIVPEVNFADCQLGRIIANPNCSTIQAMLPLKAIYDVYGLKRIVYSTYQAVSGSGQKGKDDLVQALNGAGFSFYPYDISKTCIPEIDAFLDNGYTKEEMKMINETRKILHDDDLAISATCVRVPVLNSHGVSMMIETQKPFKLDEIKKVIADFENIVLLDDNENHQYPTSIIANGSDKVYVGRIRRDLSCENALLIYCTADNIRKGAAANAVQIALKLAEQDKI